ncbi:hypothetical protein GCM10020001_061880 [Nonomuraea salmonea]
MPTPPTIEQNGWDPGHSVVEVVTDDMPFLVDSVAMELDRHDLGTHLVVHPQMRVRRDMTGRMLGRGQEDVTGQMLVESWIHMEIDRQSDPEVLKRLEAGLLKVLADVRHTVEDFAKMRALAVQTAEDLSMNPPPLEPAEVEDSLDLLRWLADGHFTFLGYREYRLEHTDEGEMLRALPGAALGILRDDKAGSESFAALPPEVRAKAREKQLMIITKANSKATVHRANYLDYIGVKLFSPDGEVIGERRFLGLFTHVAYNESISRIPVLRRKLADVLDQAGLAPDSHDGKDLIEILETFPRDELFQTSIDQLLPIALGVLRLRERKQVKLFLRRDDYGRYISCLVYLPRDRYTTKVRLKMQEVLLKALGGTSLDYSAMIGESVLARLHVVIRGERGRQLPAPSVDVEELEARLAAITRSWEDDLASALTEMTSEEEAPTLIKRYASAFPEGYKADFPPKVAVVDLRRLEELVEAGDGDKVGINLYEPYDAVEGERRLKIYKIGSPISLSRALPLIQRLGVEVVDERPYEVDRDNDPRTKNAWIYDFGLRYTPADGVGRDEFKRLFQDGLNALWTGRVQADDFNALILSAGLTWEQVEILRAYAKYLRQAGSTFSQPYMEDVLKGNVRVARLLVRLFEAKHDPRRGEDVRVDLVEALNEEILGALDEVASLDEDRILRAYLEMIQATLRTNYFQTVDGVRKPYISLKFDPQAISVLPLPRPKYEIFVYSPRVEGVHLRFGKVARGGLRWSDRMEDFRTEILGLVKAQMVKNTVIVPTGSKGGFVVKRPPKSSKREDLLAEGVACYRMFISGLLDVTDNLVDGKVVPPPDVVRHDGDDTYLVVAADKGTATFSDIANGVAKEYGFWLGDAFASGGSIGYDHKAMGITARGAWESVKYHFRTMGVDVQTTDFTVAGIGDMSGDVFGNGMLLSQHIRLVAAFDHRHIFVDPSPDAARSYAERRRLFELPRSSWEDYDAKLISPGGGVFPRTAKSIQITPQMREALGIPAGIASMAPNDLISAILRAPRRPAVERRHRHLRQGQLRVPHRRRRQGQRRAQGQRVRAALQGRRRGRQPRLHPARPHRVRAQRRAGQHRLHRQLGRRRHLRPRGQHQDPARPGRPRRRADRQAAQPGLHLDDRRGRRAGAARQQGPERGARRGPYAGRRHAPHPRPLPAQARTRRAGQPGAGVPAVGQDARRAAPGQAGADLARVLGAARLHQAGGRRRAARLRPPRRPLPGVVAGRLLPLRAARAVQAVHGQASAAPRDHHHPRGERAGQLGGHHVHVPLRRGDRRVHARHRAGLPGRARGVRPARLPPGGGVAGQRGRHRHPDRHAAGGTQAGRAGRPVAAGQPAAATRPRRVGQLLRQGRQRDHRAHTQAAHRARPGRLRGAPRRVRGPRGAGRPGRAGGRDGARVLDARPGGDLVADGTPGQRGGRGLLRPGRPAAALPAARAHHRAAPRQPVELDGPLGAARRPVRRARLADPRRAGPQPPRAVSRGAAGPLDRGQLGGGRQGQADAVGDLGERQLRPRHAVGRAARHPYAGGRQQPAPHGGLRSAGAGSPARPRLLP